MSEAAQQREARLPGAILHDGAPCSACPGPLPSTAPRAQGSPSTQRSRGHTRPWALGREREDAVSCQQGPLAPRRQREGSEDPRRKPLTRITL